MNWTKGYYYQPHYQYTSCNQHGQRYKRVASKKLSVAKLSCKTNNTDGMSRLILLSHHLDTPVHYDFGEHEAYIEVISAEEVRRL